jgi:hypothetical protein
MKITDHTPRRAGGLRADFWDDWQQDEGVKMDALTRWQPAGATSGEILMQGTRHAYTLRTGMVWAPDIAPARREAFPEVGGTRYRVTYVRGEIADARALRKGARKLRPWSRLWDRVTDEAWKWFPTK